MQNKTPLRQMKGTLHSITQVSLTVWSWVCPPEPRMKLWAHTSHWPIRGRPCRPDLQVHLVLTRVWPSPAPRGPWARWRLRTCRSLRWWVLPELCPPHPTSYSNYLLPCNSFQHPCNSFLIPSTFRRLFTWTLPHRPLPSAPTNPGNTY